ncbi:ent-kaur-16-ene synthase, chloroplastic-like isoform X2 [Typha angustifolia]|uniref:ent-kaur-16-ene synthase, chloroplastic-like isoform X2 n=1 Tax=Typha angustifolia TaxID=59011 RepID=UPI003C2CCAC5
MLSISLPSSVSFCGIRNSNFQDRRTQMAKASGSFPQNLAENVDDWTSLAARIMNRQVMCAKEPKERVRKQLLKIEISDSAYDTAWVAMVPSPGSPDVPCFPQCLDWILSNQHMDGSWGLPHLHPSLIKDAVSSTLACILALKRWNVGEEHVRRGLHFIRYNFSYIMDENLASPIGFNIIFPGMLGFAIDMGLDLNISQVAIENVLSLRDAELRRESRSTCEGGKAYIAYVAEGLGKSQDWNEVMKYQRRNGSLFNSPSTTAAALIHHHDAKALEYLRALLLKFGSSVPTAYPLELQSHLSMVDTLEKLGIARHFTYEIKTILDRIYRCWLEGDEEITSDMMTSAVAFRLLRLNGYDVSSDVLSHLGEAEKFYDSVQGHLKDMKTVVELYKASQIKISPNDEVLDKLHCWSSSLLKTELSASSNHGSRGTFEEVDYALNFPFYANMQRLEHKRNIEHFNVEGTVVLKTSYTFRRINDDLLELAVEDFTTCQSIYREEFKLLESWFKENKLDQLKFARPVLKFSYLVAASTLFSPELSDARISWAKSCVLLNMVDDFFDTRSCREELESLIALVEKWDGNHGKEFYSEELKIYFYALYNTVNEIGAKASQLQKRCVTDHWLSLMRCMMKEAVWFWNKTTPALDEYMTNGVITIGLGPIVLPALYLVGPNLSEEVVRHSEYNTLFNLLSNCARLLNDIQTLERENDEGKLNGVSLCVLHGGDSISVEEAKKEMQRDINTSRRDLLRLVLREGSVVPRPCKELFWNMSRIVHIFYGKTDETTTSVDMINYVDAVIHQPLQVDPLLPATS